MTGPFGHFNVLVNRLPFTRGDMPLLPPQSARIGRDGRTPIQARFTIAFCSRWWKDEVYEVCNANKAIPMKITEIIWLDAVAEKIESKHHCLPTEVEEIFATNPKVRKMHKGHFGGS